MFSKKGHNTVEFSIGFMGKRTDILLRAVQFCIFLLLLTPLVFWRELVYYYISTKVHFIFLVSEVALLLFVWLAWKYPQYRPKFNGIGKALLIFLAVLLMSTIAGVDPFFSFWSDFSRSTGDLMWFHLVAIFIVATSVFQTQKDWYRVFFISSLVALLVVAAHFLGRLGISLFINAKSGSTFGNSTFFGTYLLFQIFFSVYLFTQSKRKFLRLYAIGSFLVFVGTLFSIDANAAQLSLIGGLVLLVSLLLISLGRSRLQRISGSVILGGLFFVFISVSLLLFQPNSLARQWFVQQSSGSRFVIWDMAWQGIKERSWLGWGPENFEAVALKYFDPCLGSIECGGEMWFDKAHNIIFDVAVGSGLIGLFAYLLLLGTAIAHLWKSPFKYNQKNAIPAIFTTILLVYFVQNLASFDVVTSLLFFTLLLSAISSVNGTVFVGDETSSLGEKKSASVVVPLLVTGVFSLPFFFFVVQPIQGNLTTLKAVEPQPMQQHLLDYERGLSLSPMGIDRRRVYLAHSTAKFLWSTSPASIEGIQTYIQQEFGMAERSLQDSLERSPRILQTYIALGMLYQVEARLFDDQIYTSAEDVLSKTIELSPRHPSPKWALASVYLEEGKFEEAVRLTQEAVDLNPRVEKAQFLHLVALKFLGNDVRFEKALQVALSSQPSDVMAREIETLLTIEDFDAEKFDLLYLYYL
ncbi:O-antigen ligase family protein [Candidatus Uhrbacteria bacterium]|nr:O-antigen ligase family protein [Candidatus Uhrbacteria bacterium]